jgi:hypothetical protein
MKPIQQEMQRVGGSKHENQQNHQYYMITKHAKTLGKFIITVSYLNLTYYKRILHKVKMIIEEFAK